MIPFSGFSSNRRTYTNEPNPTPVTSAKNQKKEPAETENRQDFNHEEKEDTRNSDVKSIDIFGISLKFDDLLIIALLIFLYMEGVKDKSLFITLILLLLS